MFPALCHVVAFLAAQFPGRGGPGGQFDWVIGNDLPAPPYQTVVLDTSFSVITNDERTREENVIHGRVDVRNLVVKANGILEIRGPNPLFVTATGNIRIDGQIVAKGDNNLSVGTLNAGGVDWGGRGGPGGGHGGFGNPRTFAPSPKGEDGCGAFDGAHRGGEGGESGYNPGWPADSDDTHRRPAGGGGGRFGHDFLRPAGIAAGYTNPNACPDQGQVGFDAEQGFSGYPGDTRFAGAIGVITGVTPPVGGRPGTGPFTDGNPSNDFWGTMTTVGGTFIRGELDHPWAGAGGGGGGNAINSNTFPERPFDPTADEIGAGGGGGGGGVTLFALGAIEFGPAGRIDASGGTGGGGENSLQTGAVTHIGGGSGGGSGGHVVLQSSERIDLSRCSSSSHPPGGIYALGGEGGAGKNNLGGAIPGGLAVGAAADALPPDSYPAATSPCGVVQGRAGYTFTNDFPDHSVVICAGGDGGPGIVQLHTPSPSDVIPPQGPGENIYTIVQPPPVSSLPATGVPSYRTINDPARWASMFPAWGMRSRATSTWSPIHADPRGLGLPPQRASARVSVADVRELVVDGGAIEDFYLRYPSLLDGADLRISDLPDQRVVSATWDEDTSELRLELDPYGAPLRGFGQEGSIEILPRLRPGFVDAVAAKLPHDLRVRVEVQLAPSAADGSPDVSRSSVWTDAFGIASPASGFARYRVTVVPGEPAEDVEGSPHVAPAADFLRVPLGF